MLGPTVDRMFIGLVCGAAAGAVVLTAFWALGAGSSLLFALGVFAASFFGLLLILPVTFWPIWSIAQFTRLPQWVTAPVSGALALCSLPLLWAWLNADPLLGFFGADYWLLASFVGVISGFVAWLVAHWSVDRAD